MTIDAERQVKKFQDLARELECDESEEGFDERVGQLARAPKTDRVEKSK